MARNKKVVVLFFSYLVALLVLGVASWVEFENMYSYAPDAHHGQSLSVSKD